METFHRNQFVKRITIISAVDPSPLRVYTANLELCRRLDRDGPKRKFEPQCGDGGGRLLCVVLQTIVRDFISTIQIM